jgi:hypothetical protein
MSSTAERVKLAHALDVDPARLDMLAALSEDDLRTLRAQIGEALFQADKHYFTRIAALTRTVPAAVSAKLTELVLPPLLAARTAELLEPQRAADLVGRVSLTYIADVAAVMDAARAPELIAAIPAERVADVAGELLRREEWVVIGSFVAQVSDEALRRSIARFDGEHLLRVGYVLDDLTKLDGIGALLTTGQIDDMLASASRLGLWRELAEVLANLTGERIERMADRLASAPADVRAAYDRAAAEGALPADTLEALSGTR